MKVRKSAAARKTRPSAETPEPKSANSPNVGQILKRMRMQRKLTIRDVAASAGLSASFLSAVERGESDIALGRLARLATFFDHDLGSFLGYTTRMARPTFIGKNDRILVNRGKGVRYESLRLPGLNFELEVVRIDPHSGFRDALSHEGVDVLLVTEGELVLVFDGVDYVVSAGDCVTFSAIYRHKLRNDCDVRGVAIACTTGRMV